MCLTQSSHNDQDTLHEMVSLQHRAIDALVKLKGKEISNMVPRPLCPCFLFFFFVVLMSLFLFLCSDSCAGSAEHQGWLRLPSKQIAYADGFADV